MMGVPMDGQYNGGALVDEGALSADVDNFVCLRCGEGFGPTEQIVNSGGQVWHGECFV